MNLRRDFLKTGALVAAAPAILRGADDTKPIKVGLVGCGGRGTGAASQALKADDYSELVAMADIEQSRIDDSIGRLKKVADRKVKVDPDKMFNGLDAYQQLINSGVDVVLLATPPASVPSIFAPPSKPASMSSVRSLSPSMRPAFATFSRPPRWPRRRISRSWPASAGATRTTSSTR
jgi:hypothetical protein